MRSTSASTSAMPIYAQAASKFLIQPLSIDRVSCERRRVRYVREEAGYLRVLHGSPSD